MIERLCVIGPGLIGGSLARALKMVSACGEVVVGGRNSARLEIAVELGVADRYETDLGRAVQGADMVVVAVPPGAIGAVFHAIKNDLEANAVLTDVGSVKDPVLDAARQVWGRMPDFLVPGHPIAGTEQSGVEASFAELFIDRRVILTPQPETSANALERVQAMWRAAGALPGVMDATAHDRILAATSHLPHVLAYALVDSLGKMTDQEDIFRYAAGGFRDFTRIASSDPLMWRDICLANRKPLLQVLDQFSADLSELREMIEAEDGNALMACFERAKQVRDGFLQRHAGERGTMSSE